MSQCNHGVFKSGRGRQKSQRQSDAIAGLEDEGDQCGRPLYLEKARNLILSLEPLEERSLSHTLEPARGDQVRLLTYRTEDSAFVLL